MSSNPLIVWLNTLPRVEYGPLAYLEGVWPGGVYYAILNDLRQERVDMGWKEGWGECDGNVRLRNGESIPGFVAGLVAEHTNATHFVAGLSGDAGRVLEVLSQSVTAKDLIVYTERPGVYGPIKRRALGRVAIPLKYRFLVMKYRQKVGLLMPLGEAGRTVFEGYGWPGSAIANFMYCPPSPRAEASALVVEPSPVRFLYVGRLSRYTKGTDVLIKAVNRLGGSWSLSILGGHGDLVQEVKEWADGSTSISFLGSADSEGVASAILEHDVCVVPSRFDGWNVVVNEAIRLGRGVIVTDEAVSHELVEASGAGEIVSARSPRGLSDAMQRVIDRPELALEWSRLANSYASKISPEAVGQYLFDVLVSVSRGCPVIDSHGPWAPEGFRRPPLEGGR